MNAPSVSPMLAHLVVGVIFVFYGLCTAITVKAFASILAFFRDDTGRSWVGLANAVFVAGIFGSLWVQMLIGIARRPPVTASELGAALFMGICWLLGTSLTLWGLSKWGSAPGKDFHIEPEI